MSFNFNFQQGKQPLAELNNFGNLPRSRTSKFHVSDLCTDFDDYYIGATENKENSYGGYMNPTDFDKKILDGFTRFHSNSSFKTPTSADSQALSKLHIPLSKCSSMQSASFEYSEAHSVSQDLPTTKSKTSLSKLSLAFEPSSVTPPNNLSKKKSTLRNLNCGETVVISKK